MAKKTNFIQVVSWRNKEEWLQVYQKLYSNNREDIQWAVDQVSVWQSRCPNSSLLGVETTTALARAKLLDFNMCSKDPVSELQNEVSMVYAMAIVRFINLVCETGQSRAHVTPIRNIARRMGIPEWLVNLRHTCTHKHSIPSLDILRTGVCLALEWLRQNYWEKEIENLSDLLTNDAEIQSTATENIEYYLHEFQKVQFSVLYGEKGKALKTNRTVLQSTINTLRALFKKNPENFIQIMSQSGYLVPKYHHLEALLRPGEGTFLESSSIQLPLSLEKFWTPVFNLYCHNSHIQTLLKFLLEPRSQEDDFSERLAAAWSLHILNIISSQEGRIFTFSPSIDWLQPLEIALKKPTEYSPDILTVICKNAPLSEDHKHALMSLVAIFLGGVKSTIIPNRIERIYQLEDLMKHFPHADNKLYSTPGPWKNYSGKMEWKKMPLGCVIQAARDFLPTNKTDDQENECVIVVTEDKTVNHSNGLEDICPEDNRHVEDESTEKKVRKVTDLSESLIFM